MVEITEDVAAFAVGVSFCVVFGEVVAVFTGVVVFAAEVVVFRAGSVVVVFAAGTVVLVTCPKTIGANTEKTRKML
jgi:hypothetical protein